MADNKQKSKDNLIDLASERQRLQQQRAQVQRNRNPQRSGKAPEKKSSSIRWYHYIQLVLFLVLFAYFLQQCKGG